MPWHLQPQYLRDRDDTSVSNKQKKTRRKKKTKDTNKDMTEGESHSNDPAQPLTEHTSSPIDIDHTQPMELTTTHMEKLHEEGFKTYYRYYHVFVEGELIELCQSISSIEIVSHWYDTDNWCVLAKKL